GKDGALQGQLRKTATDHKPSDHLRKRKRLRRSSTIEKGEVQSSPIRNDEGPQYETTNCKRVMGPGFPCNKKLLG
ncbi:MAG TPA: hypothetical protein VGC95_13070, partial [Chitinophagaceae bacterium]